MWKLIRATYWPLGKYAGSAARLSSTMLVVLMALMMMVLSICGDRSPDGFFLSDRLVERGAGRRSVREHAERSSDGVARMRKAVTIIRL